MWDFEGKDADFYAVRLSKYPISSENTYWVRMYI